MNSLKRILQEKGISQIELASRIDVPDSIVSKWTKWGFRIPKKHQQKICEVLGCKLSDLEGGQAQ